MIRLTIAQMHALPKLIRYTQNSSMELLDNDCIRLRDGYGQLIIVRWNADKIEYFRDDKLTKELAS